MKRGLFITVEGGEGVGKSTQLAALREVLENAGVTTTVTREPGGSPIAESIREILLNPANEFAEDGTAELLLMFAARADHLSKVIRPALQAGNWVLCDRFTDATYAYQGGGRGVDPEKIRQLEQMAMEGLQPDKTLLLDAPVATALARINDRGSLDRFEREKLDFYERVRAVYLERAEAEPERFHVIDASGSVAEVEQRVMEFAANLAAAHA